MTAPQRPTDPTDSEGSLRPKGAELPPDELGSTAQFKAFVDANDDPDEARDRAAADPDGHRPVPADLPDDREIEFEPAPRQRPVAQSAPAVDTQMPPADLGSTAEFKAFVSEDDAAPAAGSADRSAARNDRGASLPDAVLPEDRVAPDNKRNLYIALGVLLLVVVVVALIFIIG